MNRREFLGMGTLAALGAAAGCRTCNHEPLAINGIRIGVQMYSVSELWKSDPAAAFKRFKVDFVFQPLEKSTSAEEWRKHSEWLLELGEKFKPYGIRVGYHNHQHEFTDRYGGKRPIDFLYEAGIAMELDLGHVKLAKDDPIAWLNRLKGRVPSIHAKPAGGNTIGGKDDANEVSDNAAVNARADIVRYNGWSLQ